MIAISAKVRYGVAVVLTIATAPTNTLYQIKALSEKCKIPKAFLEQVLIKLKKDGILKSVRGAKGGYLLAKKAEEITVLEIWQALEGREPLETGYSGAPILKQFWKGLQETINGYSNHTIGQLIRDKQKQEKMVSYSI